MKRYYIDERVGCMAVRDRELDASRDDEPGLWSHTTGVVRYFCGVVKTKVCPTCQHKSADGWAIDEADRTEAREACERLNAEEELF